MVVESKHNYEEKNIYREEGTLSGREAGFIIIAQDEVPINLLG